MAGFGGIMDLDGICKYAWPLSAKLDYNALPKEVRAEIKSKGYQNLCMHFKKEGELPKDCEYYSRYMQGYVLCNIKRKDLSHNTDKKVYNQIIRDSDRMEDSFHDDYIRKKDRQYVSRKDNTFKRHDEDDELGKKLKELKEGITSGKLNR